MTVPWHERTLAIALLVQDLCKLQTLQAETCSGKTCADFNLASHARLPTPATHSSSRVLMLIKIVTSLQGMRGCRRLDTAVPLQEVFDQRRQFAEDGQGHAEKAVYIGPNTTDLQARRLARNASSRPSRFIWSLPRDLTRTVRLIRSNWRSALKQIIATRVVMKHVCCIFRP